MTPADLRAWQARMGYTQAQTAHALGMSLSGYQQLRAGKSRTTGKPLVSRLPRRSARIRVNPTSEQVRAARDAAGLTQAAAAEMVHCARRTWQDWEAGKRKMPPGLFELFTNKAKNV